MSDPAQYDMVRKALVAEKDAILVGVSDLPLLETKEMNRRWSITDEKNQRLAQEFLDKFSSSNNDSEISYVDKPTASVEKYTGTWRVIENRMSKKSEPAGVFQLLREGWLTTLAADEAKLTVIQGEAATGTLVIQQFWRNIDPILIQALTASINNTTIVTNPRSRHENYTGSFVSSNVAGSIMPGDGAGTVSRTLTQIQTPTGATSSALATSLATFAKLETQDNEILKLFSWGTLTGEGDGLAIIIRNLNPAITIQTTCLNTITDADIVAKLSPTITAWQTNHEYNPGDLVTESAVTYQCILFVENKGTSEFFATQLSDGKWLAYTAWTYGSRKWIEEQNGTATFAVLFRKVAWVPNATAGTIHTFERDGFDPSVAAWATNTEYAAGTLVSNDGKIYQAVVLVVNGGKSETFATQLAAGKWMLYSLQSKVDGADAMPVSYLATVLAGTGKQSGFALEGMNFSESGDGEGHFRRQQTFLNSSFDGIRISWSPAYGSREEQEVVEWENVSAKDAYTIKADATTNAAAMVSATYLPSPASHRLANCTISRGTKGGCFNVRRTTYVPASSVFFITLAQDYCIYRSYIEKTTKVPVTMIGETPSDGYFWRTIMEEIHCRWHTSDTELYRFIGETSGSVYPGLAGSFVEYKGGGKFYAEKVVGRVLGDWEKKTLATDGFELNDYARPFVHTPGA